MRKKITGVIALISMMVFGLACADLVVFTDNFNTANSTDLNADLATRTAGSAVSMKWGVFSVPAQNTLWTIDVNKMKYTGGGSVPEKLYLLNTGNDARQNLATQLAGQKYEIKISFTVNGTDAADSIALALHDNVAGTAALNIEQIRSRSQIDVEVAGAATRYDTYGANGLTHNLRVVVDETVVTPTFEVFIDNVSTQTGTLTLGASRYVYLQMIDADGDGGFLVDDFSVTVIPEPATLGLFVVASAAVLAVRRLRFK